jgi:pimeloyl-ACP methyl ester carboxylesterase
VTFIDGAGGVFQVWKKQLPEFKLHYNVLIIELKEKNGLSHSLDELDLDTITNGILRVLEDNNIAKSHFIGLSLGTVFVKYFSWKYPLSVDSMILAGAVTKINRGLQLLFKVRSAFKSIISSTAQFGIFTYYLLPVKNHKETRLFIKQQSTAWKEEDFLKWSEFARKLNPVLNYLYSDKTEIPSLFIMGEEDKVFLPSVKRRIASNKSDTLLFIIQDCGHFVNMEQAMLFNRMVIGYLTGLEHTTQNGKLGIGGRIGLIPKTKETTEKESRLL